MGTLELVSVSTVDYTYTSRYTAAATTDCVRAPVLRAVPATWRVERMRTVRAYDVRILAR
eukprot:COSAG02_NODE_354_length_24016_cov_208.299231_13_plen_60_part_00